MPESKHNWLLTALIGLAIVILASMVYPLPAKGDTICKTTCIPDGYGNPVCTTVCQDVD